MGDSTSGATTPPLRRSSYRVPLKEKTIAPKNIKIEVELGFDPKLDVPKRRAASTCDVADGVRGQAVSFECALVSEVRPLDAITFTVNGEERDLRGDAGQTARQREPAEILRSRGELQTGASWPRTRMCAEWAWGAGGAVRKKQVSGTCRLPAEMAEAGTGANRPRRAKDGHRETSSDWPKSS